MARPTIALGRNPFVGGVATLMAGTALAQAIPIAISPILTRLYSPTDFGLFTLFMSLTAVLGSIACARYELAIMLPDKDDDAVLVAALGLLIALGLAVASLVAVLLFGAEIARSLGDADLRPLLILVPPAVALTGLFNSLSYLTTRKGQFRSLSRANVFKSGTGALTQIFLGLSTAGPPGLAVGYSAAPLGGGPALLFHLRSKYRFRGLDWNRMATLARRYREFPTYSVGSALAQTSLLVVVSAVISRAYSPADLGEYALVQRVFGAPLVLISASVGHVFYQRASSAKRDTGSMRDVFVATLKPLVALSLVCTVLLAVSLPTLFPLVFGGQWSGAGVLALYLLPGFAAQFVTSPLSLSNQVNMRNRFGLMGNMALLVLVTGVLLAAAAAGLGVRHALLWMSLTQAFYYVVFLRLIYGHVSQSENPGKIG